MKKNLLTKEDQEFWDFIEKTAEKVKHWPKWLGGDGVEPVCCPQCNRPYDKETPEPKRVCTGSTGA